MDSADLGHNLLKHVGHPKPVFHRRKEQEGMYLDEWLLLKLLIILFKPEKIYEL